mmetsp:Transcript_6283/g.14300  ORF Transcript_6283/g.14300 Transcript_6283/m.14300 type:complete len:210 (+) Transcript_6283:79-708(+)
MAWPRPTQRSSNSSVSTTSIWQRSCTTSPRNGAKAETLPFSRTVPGSLVKRRTSSRRLTLFGCWKAAQLRPRSWTLGIERSSADRLCLSSKDELRGPGRRTQKRWFCRSWISAGAASSRSQTQACADAGRRVASPAFRTPQRTQPCFLITSIARLKSFSVRDAGFGGFGIFTSSWWPAGSSWAWRRQGRAKLLREASGCREPRLDGRRC